MGVSRTREEWIGIYEKKCKVKYAPEPYEMQAYHPEHGFLSFIHPDFTDKGVFEVHLMVGDGKYWMKLIKQAMKDTGCDKIRYITRRNPETWARRYGARVIAYIMEANIDEIKAD